MGSTDASRGVGRQIAFVTRVAPVAQRNGSSTYVLQLLKLLAEAGAQVTVVVTLAASRSPRPWFWSVVPLPEGVRLEAPGYWRIGRLFLSPLRPKAWARAAVRIGPGWICGWMQRIFGSGLYCEAWDLTEPTEEERALVRAAVQSAGADVVMVNYAFWAPVFADLGGVRKVILMHDLLSARVGQFESLGWALDCPDIRVETERTWLREADVIVAAQTQEAEQVRGWVTGRVLVGPVALRSTGAEGFVERERCLFVGSNAMPNVAGLQWFLRQVWPAVRAARPGARLAVAGSVGGAIDAEERDGVEKLGVLPSLDAEYARAAVCVVPLVMGSGVKIKLIEALSFGKATVATGLATEGLAAEVSSAVVVCDYPAEFAAAVVRLMTDDVWRSEREEAARQAFAAALDRGAQSAFLEAVLG